ncbi:MAG: thiolase family protein, partial [Deltaproteobacteria bacterium]|nr:thiolase family protein [Deltaproteobacteria bacterium]
MYTQAYIPFRGYWSTPFCRWQMSLQNENAIVLGAATAKKALELRHIPAEALDG